jgi:hypothetical protein
MARYGVGVGVGLSLGAGVSLDVGDGDGALDPPALPHGPMRPFEWRSRAGSWSPALDPGVSSRAASTNM